MELKNRHAQLSVKKSMRPCLVLGSQWKLSGMRGCVYFMSEHWADSVRPNKSTRNVNPIHVNKGNWGTWTSFSSKVRIDRKSPLVYTNTVLANPAHCWTIPNDGMYPEQSCRISVQLNLTECTLVSVTRKTYIYIACKSFFSGVKSKTLIPETLETHIGANQKLPVLPWNTPSINNLCNLWFIMHERIY